MKKKIKDLQQGGGFSPEMARGCFWVRDRKIYFARGYVWDMDGVYNPALGEHDIEIEIDGQTDNPDLPDFSKLNDDQRVAVGQAWTAVEYEKGHAQRVLVASAFAKLTPEEIEALKDEFYTG